MVVTDNSLNAINSSQFAKSHGRFLGRNGDDIEAFIDAILLFIRLY